MRGGGSWGRSRLLLDVATSYSDRGTRGVEMMPLRWRGILGSIEAVLAAPPDMGGICESRDWFWLDGGEKRCCWRWASRWLEPTPFISRSSSSWKRTNIVVIHVALPRYCSLLLLCFGGNLSQWPPILGACFPAIKNSIAYKEVRQA